ncbi:DUF4287 domain-containing protein [Jiangella anatolica]|uniref:DUF4287 domain-containing protein n=1 Tax=Jiangella anatolica TaxID=2670374 RepID=A0A2W2BDD7_9ACTN|nr:DUF4287 domain-containing protein [Jiangella anatolica]
MASQVRTIERSTGRTVGQWAEVVAAAGLEKHGQIVSFLKTEHGLTHGNANTLAHRIRESSGDGPPSDAELLDAQYRGAKAALRPIYDEVVLVATGLGDDVTVAVKKTGVSLRRKKQFALVEAPSAKRLQLGFNLRGVAPTDRLRAMTGMCTHATDLTDVGDVDDLVAGWLRAAYDGAG